MLNIKEYILNKLNESQLDKSGINLYLFFGKLTGYKLFNLTGGDIVYNNLTEAFKSLEINNELYKPDFDTYNINSITLKDAAMPEGYNKYDLPKSFIIESNDFTIGKFQPRFKTSEPIMLLLLAKEKTILLLPAIDEQGGEPRTWVLDVDTLFDEQKGIGGELIGMYTDEQIYDCKELIKRYIGKPIKNIDGIFVSLDQWYDNHEDKTVKHK